MSSIHGRQSHVNPDVNKKMANFLKPAQVGQTAVATRHTFKSLRCGSGHNGNSLRANSPAAFPAPASKGDYNHPGPPAA